MITDSLTNAYRYFRIHEEFENLFQVFINIVENPNNLSVFENSNIRFQEGILTRSRDCLYEYHKKFLDIHICIAGTEVIDFAQTNCAQEVIHTDEDMYLTDGNYSGEIKLGEGQFVIIFPGELHKPQLGEEHCRISKCIAKVLVSEEY